MWIGRGNDDLFRYDVVTVILVEIVEYIWYYTKKDQITLLPYGLRHGIQSELWWEDLFTHDSIIRLMMQTRPFLFIGHRSVLFWETMDFVRLRSD